MPGSHFSLPLSCHRRSARCAGPYSLRPAFASLFVFLVLLSSAAPAPADTVYVAGELRVGLHEERTVDSPILKLVPSGTALEVVKKEENLSFVRDPEGATGWIDNSYLNATPPSSAAVENESRTVMLEQRLSDARQRIHELEAQAAAGPAAGEDGAETPGLQKDLADARQKLKEERLKVGELQVQVAELRKRIGLDNDATALIDQIERLQADKKKLEVALAAAADGRAPTPGDVEAADGIRVDAGRLAAYVVIILVIGFGGGVYFLDYFNRRRHGGFRV